MLIQLVFVAYHEHREVEDIYPVPSPCSPTLFDSGDRWHYCYSVVTEHAVQESVVMGVVELWTLYAFAVSFTFLRTYARISAVGYRQLQVDDYLVWIAIVSN